MRRHLRLPLALAAAVVLASCGGSDAPHSGSSSKTDTTTQPDPRTRLEQAAREAIQRDYMDGVRSLWTNHVAARPVATDGPALAQVRRSVANRRKRGIRVRMLSDRLRIESVRLDPSYERATALVVAHQRVLPSDRNGRPLGRLVVLNERARLDLRRVGRSDRFVVWKVMGRR
jgi:hypothetical protein